ncbi:MAG: hypothetical protein AAGA48_31465 [Myxococcota bacterium]
MFRQWILVIGVVACRAAPTVPTFPTTTVPSSECGDGVIGKGEVCDDGVNDGAYGGCEPDCTALASFCGDGVNDGLATGEACDDGNDVDGDGCNNDCRESGRTLWVDFRDSYFSPFSLGQIALGPAGTSIAVGTQRELNGPTVGIMRHYEADGSEIWTEMVEGPAPSDLALFRIVTLPDGFAVGGTMMGYQPWVSLVDPVTGDPSPSLAIDYDTVCGTDYAGGFSLNELGAASPNGFVATADGEGADWMYAFDLQGNCVAAEVVENTDQVLTTPSGNSLLALSRGFNKSIVGGASLIEYDYDLEIVDRTQLTVPFGAVMTYTPDGGLLIVSEQYGAPTFLRLDETFAILFERTRAEPDVTLTLRDVDVDTLGNIVVVGRSTSGKDEAAFVRKYDAETNLQWTREMTLGDNPRGWTDVAIDEAGDILVTGAGDDAGSWTMKLAR